MTVSAEQTTEEIWELCCRHRPSRSALTSKRCRSETCSILSGTLPMEGGVPQFRGRFGEGLQRRRRATRRATGRAQFTGPGAAASGFARQDPARVVRLTVTLATTPEFVDHPKVADGASELLREPVRGRACVDSDGVGCREPSGGASSVVVEMILAV